MERIFLTIGAVMGALGVGAGAFAAHGLKARLTPDLLAMIVGWLSLAWGAFSCR